MHKYIIYFTYMSMLQMSMSVEVDYTTVPMVLNASTVKGPTPVGVPMV